MLNLGHVHRIVPMRTDAGVRLTRTVDVVPTTGYSTAAVWRPVIPASWTAMSRQRGLSTLPIWHRRMEKYCVASAIQSAMEPATEMYAIEVVVVDQ